MSEKQEIEKNLRAIVNESVEESYENVEDIIELVLQKVLTLL